MQSASHIKLCELEAGSNLYHEALELRYELFFQQHGLPWEIITDEHENTSRHIGIVSNGSLIAYGRITNLGEGVYKLSQIVVKPQQQGKGYGVMMLKKLVELAIISGGEKIILNARTTATQWYRKQGFISNGGEFLSQSTGVPHVQMLYSPDHT